MLFAICALFLVPFFHVSGAWVAAGIAGVVFLLLLVLPEWLIPRLHHGSIAEQQRGLNVSYARVLESLGRTRGPSLWIYPSPAPQALCARSWGGGGVILVSQGLLSVTQEDDLRRILGTAVMECRGITLLRCSVYAFVASLLARIAPQSWSRVVYSPRMRSRDLKSFSKSPFSAILFLALWFWIDFFRANASRDPSRSERVRTYLSASHKQGLVWEENLFPAFESLQLVQPLRS
jgi:hypothetical protein